MNQMDDGISDRSKQDVNRLLSIFRDRARQIASDVGMLFGSDSSPAESVQNLSERHIRHWETLCGNRGVSLPVFAFVGPRGAGKTALAQLLVCGEGNSLQGGETSKGKLQWIGPTPPAAIEPEIEQFLRVRREDLFDLGRPYLILDTPGFGKQSPRLKEVIHRAFASTRFKVLVVDSHKIRAQQWQEEMSIGDGSIVLPVIHMDPTTTTEHRTNPASVGKTLGAQVHEGLKQHMSGSTLLDPVILPDFDTKGDLDALRESKSLLTDALRQMLEKVGTEGSDRSSELEASWPIFVSALREIIDPLITERVREQHALLDQVLKSMPRLVVNEMLEDDRGLTALIRLDLRASLMERVPTWAVPFRAAAGLLCLTTGVWDRLVLGMAGSLPSTLITLYGAVRGRKEERNAEELHREKVNGTIERIVRGHLYKPFGDFKAALAKNVEDDAFENETRCDFKIHGISPLAASWQQALREATRIDPGKGRGWLIAAALLATFVFWFLISGPLVHSYGQYIPAVFRSLFGAWDDGQLSTYPAMGGGFWLTAVVLSIIPVFIIAMLVVSRSLSRAKTSACLLTFRKTMDDEIQKGAILLDVEVLDPKINAYQRLLASIREKGLRSALDR